MIDDQQKVSIISEALPYLQRFHGKTIVIKYGGSCMSDPNLRKKVIDDVVLLHYVGVRVILVHGGGPEINQMLNKLNIPVRFREGLRITDSETMEIVEMVLTGKVQKELVGLLNTSGAKAVGISGRDGNLLQAVPVQKAGEDWGYTGEVKAVNQELLSALLEKGYLPVISSIAQDEDYQSYNVNADQVASEIAVTLQAEKLLYLTDTPGILQDINQPDSLIRRINKTTAQSLIKEGKISGGMLPKLASSLDCIDRGVGAVHILNGGLMHSILLEIFTNDGVGTMIS